jgi:hypothetical protein
MQAIAESTGLSTPEIWALNPEVGREAVNSGNINS